MFNVAAHAYQLSKAGNEPGECDDRFQLPKNIRRAKQSFRFAVADGATESAFSGLWADMLVKAYVNTLKRKRTSAEEFFRVIEQKAPVWSKLVWEKPLSWFAQEKVQLGSFSTFLGLYLEDNATASAQGYWRAIGIGDTCVFHVRGNELITSFPLIRAEQFGNRPILLSTNPARNAILHQQIELVECGGEWLTGDRFLLMTDALAHWFLNQVEAGELPWLEELAENAFESVAQFQAWVDRLRLERVVRNDDVTLLMIRVEKHEISADG